MNLAPIKQFASDAAASVGRFAETHAPAAAEFAKRNKVVLGKAGIGALTGAVGGNITSTNTETDPHAKARNTIKGAVVGAIGGAASHHLMGSVRRFGRDYKTGFLENHINIHKDITEHSSNLTNPVLRFFGKRKPTMKARKAAEGMIGGIEHMISTAEGDSKFSPAALGELKAIHHKLTSSEVNTGWHTVGSHWNKFNEVHGKDVEDLFNRNATQRAEKISVRHNAALRKKNG